MPGWRHTKATCSNFLSATWTKCSLNLRSCPIHIFASRRYHLPQQECVAMPTQLVHLRFSVTDTRGKINSVLLSQDRQRWPRARQPGQNSASQVYGDSTGFLQPASLPTPTQEHMPHLSLVSFLLPEKPENMFLLRGPRATGLNFNNNSLWSLSDRCLLQETGLLLRLHIPFLGRSDCRKPKRRVREEAKLVPGPGLCSGMS